MPTHEDSRRIFGINIQVSMNQYGYPELVEAHRSMMRERVLHDVDAAGYTPTGTVAERLEFVQYVKVHHHEHGWQMERRTATQETAESVILTAEVIAEEVPADAHS